jgi:hypothetical protein
VSRHGARARARALQWWRSLALPPSPHPLLLFFPSLSPSPLPPVPSYDLLNWNYDVNKAYTCRQANQNPQQCSRASQTSVSLLGSVVTCRSCYFYIGADFRFKLLFDRFTVKDFLVSVTGAASAALDVLVAYPTGSSSAGPTTLNLINRRLIATVPIPIGPLDLRASLYVSLDAVVSASAQSTGRIIGPGYWFESSVTVGARYTNGQWYDLTGSSIYMNSRAPVLDITVTASAKVTLPIKVEVGGSLSFGASNFPSCVAPAVSNGFSPFPNSRV